MLPCAVSLCRWPSASFPPVCCRRKSRRNSGQADKTNQPVLSPLSSGKENFHFRVQVPCRAAKSLQHSIPVPYSARIPSTAGVYTIRFSFSITSRCATVGKLVFFGKSPSKNFFIPVRSPLPGQKNLHAVTQALEKGMSIPKLPPRRRSRLEFTPDADLAVYGLKFSR